MDIDQMQDQNGLRVDGRRPHELRQINVRLGVFGQADGSAYIEQGNTKVLATVYGPHQPRGASARSTVMKSTKGIINCQYSMAVFCPSSGDRKKRPRGDKKTQERSIHLRHALEAILNLEKFPRSQIDVFIEVLQADGSDYCVSINAATLALIDAGIPIKDFAIGCTVSLQDSSSTFNEEETNEMGILDVNHLEETGPGFTLSVVVLPETVDELTKEPGIILVTQGSGQRLHLSRLKAMQLRALNGCKNIKSILEQIVQQHLATNALPSLYNTHTVE
ncbi:exosome complex component RRP41 [Chelonus insularis]|uniref:exosome complex component RRP41 n=1 Tax=Chelonus insularis TaxID=460826 RepID=UPI001589D840|nr:exosome complex component RRP41 [Chelonus insularis]